MAKMPYSPVPSLECETQKTIAVRMSVESLDDMMCSSLKFDDEVHWLWVTHLFWDGLRVLGDGTVVDTEPEVTQSPATYVPVIKDLARKWNIKTVWSMPMFADDSTMMNVVRANGQLFLESLRDQVESNGIQALEIDIHTLYVAVNAQMERWQLLESIDVAWVLALSNTVRLPDDIAAFLNAFLQAMYKPVTIVIKSFGFLRINDLRTSHGTYRTMHIQAEASITHFDVRYREIMGYVKSIQPQPRILMEIDTCGVEYARSRHHRATAERFRLCPLRSIRHRKMFGSESFSDRYCSASGSCMLEFGGENTVISYDNEQVRKMKFDFILENDLDGVLLGELHNDLAPLHPLSLMNEAVGRLWGRADKQ